MLFVIIDILEKMLAWLRPFALKKDQALESDLPATGGVQWSADFEARTETLGTLTDTPPELPVITDLKLLLRDKRINRDPNIQGYLAEHGTKRIFYGPVKADLAVWYSMNLKYGSQYLVHWNA